MYQIRIFVCHFCLFRFKNLVLKLGIRLVLCLVSFELVIMVELNRRGRENSESFQELELKKSILLFSLFFYSCKEAITKCRKKSK